MINFLKKNKDLILGAGTVLILVVLGLRLALGLNPPETEAERSTLETALGIQPPPFEGRETRHPEELEWTFEGPLGTYDRASLRRGLQVYREVCAACHGLEYIAFRNLTDLGYSEAQAESIAEEYMITDGPDEFGDMFERPGRLSDYFPNPFPNENAAKAANGGKAPPDLSLIVKAREGGADYVHALLTGYVEPPADFVPNSDITYYNPYFEGWEIVMPPPLFEGQMEYPDGTEATVEQMSRDVTNFLMWTAEPKLEERHEMGFKVFFYVLVLTVLLYISMKKIWRRVKK